MKIRVNRIGSRGPVSCFLKFKTDFMLFLKLLSLDAGMEKHFCSLTLQNVPGNVKII